MNCSFAKKVGLSLLVAALLAGCGDKKNEAADDEKTAPTQVAAKVNGTELTVYQVNYALQRISNMDQNQAKAASLQVVKNLVNQEVIAQKALDDKLDRDPMVVQALDAARRQILAEAYMSKKLGTSVESSDGEVTEYFNQHPELFSKRKLYRLQEISIKAPREKHDAISAQLNRFKKLDDFVAWLKAEKLETKTGHGVKSAEQLPIRVASQLSNMPDGRALIVNTPEELTVIILVDSRLQPVTLEQAKPAIDRMLQTQARQKAAKAELDALKSAAKIEYLGEFADASKEDAASADKPATRH